MGDDRPREERQSPEWIKLASRLRASPRVVLMTRGEVAHRVGLSQHIDAARTAAEEAWEPMRRVVEEAETNAGLRIVLGQE